MHVEPSEAKEAGRLAISLVSILHARVIVGEYHFTARICLALSMTFD